MSFASTAQTLTTCGPEGEGGTICYYGGQLKWFSKVVVLL